MNHDAVHFSSAAHKEMQARFNQKLLELLSVEPITSQPRSPYFAEAVEETLVIEDFRAAWEASKELVEAEYANAAMIARDGPARPSPVVIQEPEKSTAHKAIAGLTFLGAVDHRLGAYRR